VLSLLADARKNALLALISKFFRKACANHENSAKIAGFADENCFEKSKAAKVVEKNF